VRPSFLTRNIGFSAALRPNAWDLAAFPLVLGVIWALAFSSIQMGLPYNVGDPTPIHLEPDYLPYYLMRSILRMGAGLVCALTFTLVYATLAAKSRYAEKILIPILDILQSVPIFTFEAVSIAPFIGLFPGSLFGVECASIFAIFTSQAWNMTFSFYQSLRTVPHDMKEAAEMFHLSTWQRFWRLELPFSANPLIWNMMMSVSGGWFFVVSSEALTVSGQSVMLPGIGSYIAVAIAERDLTAIIYAILAMLVAILLYDQLFFRPLLAWGDKFKYESMPGEDVPESRFLTFMQRTRLVRKLSEIPTALWNWSLPIFRRRGDRLGKPVERKRERQWIETAWNSAIALTAAYALIRIGQFVNGEVSYHEVLEVFGKAAVTAVRVLVLIALASLVWVPIGVWIGLRPRVAQMVQPVAQFLAAFPVNLVWPVAVVGILKFHLNVNIWTSPLMILGTQWYILFNVIAGASAIPTDLKDVAGNFGVRGWLRWKRMILPAIFPSYVTGAITASVGSWNVSIYSEYVSWGETNLVATGVGAYIFENSAKGDFPRIALGTGVMVMFVMLFNRQIWRRLYKLAEERWRIE